jgi:hypothetical protein
MIPFIAIIMKYFIKDSNMDQLIGMLKFVIPMCIGLPIVMGGSGFIASFYQSQKEVIIQGQLYRHVIVSLYFIIGAFSFFIYPIAKQIIVLKQD